MTQEKKILAGGCFCGMQDLIRKSHWPQNGSACSMVRLSVFCRSSIEPLHMA